MTSSQEEIESVQLLDRKISKDIIERNEAVLVYYDNKKGDERSKENNIVISRAKQVRP